MNLLLATAVILSCKTLVAVDGDTIRCDGERMRLLGDGAPFVSGIDAPEIRRARCGAEKLLGERARHRLAELIRTDGLVIEDSRKRDSYRRPLVRLRLPDGRTAGGVLLAEGLAVKWLPGQRYDWCAR